MSELCVQCLKRTITLLMALLVIGANHVTVCHADDGRSAEPHFIAEACGSHTETGHGDESGECSDSACRHEICPRQSVLDEYPPTVSLDLDAILPAVVAPVMRLFKPCPRPASPVSYVKPPLIPARSAILRM
jgi:hypothetical protein